MFAAVVNVLIRRLIDGWIPKDWKHEFVRAVIGVVVAAVLGTIGTAVWWLNRDTQEQKESRIRLTAIRVSGPPKYPVAGINVYFDNAADAVARGMVYKPAFAFRPGGAPPTSEELVKLQDALLESMEASTNETWELHPRDRPMFKTFPDKNSDPYLSKYFTEMFDDIERGDLTVAVMITWKYKDDSSGDRNRVTEECFWMSGSWVQHTCGRRRVFLEGE